MKFVENYRLRKYVATAKRLNGVNAYLAGITDPDIWDFEVALAHQQRDALQRRLTTIATKLRSNA
jgi:hypothetical protein